MLSGAGDGNRICIQLIARGTEVFITSYMLPKYKNRYYQYDTFFMVVLQMRPQRQRKRRHLRSSLLKLVCMHCS